MGYFPDSLWGGRFTKVTYHQWFGLVTEPTATPCSDMGNGQFGTATSGARVSNIRFLNGTTPVNLATLDTQPAYYRSTVTAANEFRYGGPGAC